MKDRNWTRLAADVTPGACYFQTSYGCVYLFSPREIQIFCTWKTEWKYYFCKSSKFSPSLLFSSWRHWRHHVVITHHAVLHYFITVLPDTCIVGASFYQTSWPTLIMQQCLCFGNKSCEIWLTAFVLSEPKQKYELHPLPKKFQ